MNFAPVLPPKLYPLLDTGKYHLVQAHQVQYNESVCEWFAKCVQSDHTVILDNGAFELGTADATALVTVARRIQPSVVVCPDAYQNSGATLTLMHAHYDVCTRYSQDVMIVPQGRSVREWIECAREMLYWTRNHVSVPVVGVPKVLDSYDGGRVEAIDWLINNAGVPQEQIHLLGIWTTVRGVVDTCRQFPRLAGVDSTLPFATALSVGPFTLDSPKTGLDDNDFKMTADIDWMLHARAEANIERIRKWVSQL